MQYARPYPPLLTSVPGIVSPALPPAAGQATLALQFQLERSQWWSAESLLARQFGQMRHLLAHTLAHVPYYRGHLARAGMSSLDQLSPASFARWPLLTKQEVVAQHAALAARIMPPGHGDHSWGDTTGSTGVPLRVLTTAAAGFYQRAMVMRNQLWHGFDFAQKLLVIRPGPAEGRFAQWSVGAGSAFRTGEMVQLPTSLAVDALLERVLAEAPGYLQGPPSLLREMIILAAASGRRPRGLKLLHCFAEAMPADLPQLARDQWDVPVIDVYSCTECGILALNCPEHGNPHAMSESVYLELLRDDGTPCAAGETGRVVVTALHNFAMPLIRYDLGDRAERAAPCACGRGLATLGRVFGRTASMLVDPQGRRYWPILPRSDLDLIAPLRQMQYHQLAPDLIEIRYRMERKLTPDEALRLTARFRIVVQYPFRYVFSRSLTDLRSGNGKLEPTALQ